MNRKCYSLALVGAGNRGLQLARLLGQVPNRGRIAAVVEPKDSSHIRKVIEVTKIPEDSLFRNHHELLDAGFNYDGVIVTTPPNTHAEIVC